MEAITMKPISLTQAVKITVLMILLSGLIACPKTSEKNGTTDQTVPNQTQEGEIDTIGNTVLEKYVKHVPDKGYCVEEYDEDGCNTCSLVYVNKTWAMNCTNNGCLKVDKEKANQCTKYLSKEELLKTIAATEQAQGEETDNKKNTPSETSASENTPQTEQRLVHSDKDAAEAAKNTFCGEITQVNEDQNGLGYWILVRKSSDSVIKVFIKKSSVIPENNCPSWCDTWLSWVPWCD